jgi:hypothetical protein
LSTQWLSGRAFGQTGQCSQPDGTGCTLFECDFSTPNFRQCNLSRVSGFNIPMGFSFDDAACGGNFCNGPGCDGNAAFSNPTDGGPSLRQCNNPGVGMQYVLSSSCHVFMDSPYFLLASTSAEFMLDSHSCLDSTMPHK